MYSEENVVYNMNLLYFLLRVCKMDIYVMSCVNGKINYVNR